MFENERIKVNHKIAELDFTTAVELLAKINKERCQDVK